MLATLGVLESSNILSVGMRQNVAVATLPRRSCWTSLHFLTSFQTITALAALLDSASIHHQWSPDLQSKDVRAVIAASVAINVLVLAIPFYINRVYTSVLPQQSGDSLVVITGMLFAVVLLDLLLKILRSWVLTLLNGAEEQRLRVQAIRHYLAAPLEVARSQSLDQRLEQVRAAGFLRNRFLQQWIFLRIDLPFVALYLLVMGLIGGWLFLIPILSACVFYPQAQRASRDATAIIRARYAMQESRDDVLISALSGTETVKGLGIEGFLVRRLEPMQESLSAAEYQQQVVNARLQHVGQLYAQVTGLMVVTFGSILVVNHSLATGALAACTLLSRQVSRPFSRYFSLVPRFALIDYGADKINELLSLDAEPGFYNGRTEALTGEVRLGALRMNLGETCVLTGSTPRELAALIAGVLGHQPCSLHPLTIGGVNVESMRSSERRKSLRAVSARSDLFNGTVLDNLTAFRPQTRREAAIECCKQLSIHDQLIALPRGYETPIGEQADFPLGSDLAFRLAVASALLEQPALLIIDGTDHALDAATLHWIENLPIAVPRLVVLNTLPYALQKPMNVIELGMIQERVSA